MNAQLQHQDLAQAYLTDAAAQALHDAQERLEGAVRALQALADAGTAEAAARAAWRATREARVALRA